MISDGPAKTRNKALDLIKNYKIKTVKGDSIPYYDFVAYCDSDDRWKPNHLEFATNGLKYTAFNGDGAEMVYTDCDFVKEDGTQVSTYGVPYYDDFNRENLLKQNFIYISTVVHRIECLHGLEDGFDPSCVPMEDYDMWLRISKKNLVKHLQCVTVTYMYKDGGSYYTAQQSAKAHAKVHFKNGILNDWLIQVESQESLESLQSQLDEIKEMKNKTVRSQKYEDAARLRDAERTILDKMHSLKGPETIEGWLSVREGNALAFHAEGKDCLEIGSYKGKSANYIAAKAKSLVCIDSFRADGTGQTQYVDHTTLNAFLDNTRRFKNITPVIGKSQDVFSQFENDRFDMIFIDGMHDYDSVMNDIDHYWAKLKVGGVMCFHDYQKDWPGVIKAVNLLFIRPDELHDTIAVVVKKTDKLEDQISKDQRIQALADRFTVMTKLMVPNERIESMPYWEFDNIVHELKEIDRKETPIKEDYKGTIIICPWSRNLPNGEENPKNFPYWDELVFDLKKEGYYLIQIGSAGEKYIGAHEVVMNSSFDMLKDLLDRASTFISIDSFFPHFAHYHGKHGVVIFSQSDPKLFGYEENLNILKSRDYLRKEQFWLWTQAKYNKDAFTSSKEVLDKVLELLQLSK